jgi:hypothetical protein
MLDPVPNLGSHQQPLEMAMPEAVKTILEQLRAGSVAPAELSGSASRSRARARYNAALKLVRRVHMYVGLFLTPWGFLYGVSAFLFNHPDAFPDQESRRVDRSETAGTSLEAMPDSRALAARVVEALNARADGRSYRLNNSNSATLSWPLTATATGSGREHAVEYDLDSGTVTIRSKPTAGHPPQGLPDGETLPLEDSPRDRLARGVPELLSRLGIKADEVSIRYSPDLVFDLDAEGQRLRVAYNIQTERLSVRPADDPAGRLSNRRFLTWLHLTFGYPSRLGARWLWAVVVDMMAAAMVVWGCSGLLMWWQMKSLRRWGAVTLTASVIAATCLALGMYSVLSR